MNLHQLSPRHRSESAFALSKRRVQALRDLPCNLWYTMSSRKQAEVFKKKRIRFLSRVQIETFGNHLFFETRKGWFQEFGPIDIIYRYIRIYIYIIGLKWKTVVWQVKFYPERNGMPSFSWYEKRLFRNLFPRWDESEGCIPQPNVHAVGSPAQ